MPNNLQNNVIDQMETRIFEAQTARLSRVTGRTPNADFLREMYVRVKEQYVKELQKRKIRLRALDGVRMDELVSYIFYYHLFQTSHLPPEIVVKLEGDEKYARCSCGMWRSISSSTSTSTSKRSPIPLPVLPRSPLIIWRAAIRSSCSAASRGRTAA